MNKNPLNLAIRFLLELAMLIAIGLWGWYLTQTWLRYLSAFGLPIVAATLWGVFRVPNDPNAAPVEISGRLRLLIEWLLFAFAVWALLDLGEVNFSFELGTITTLHYLISYDRTWALLRNKPYELKRLF